MTTAQDFVTSIKPTFCPGCGNFGIMEALKMALAEMTLKPHDICLSFDIGCNSNMADFVKCYGFHGLHGRSTPAAAAMKLANHKLKVIALTGDGGYYGEGGAHFLTLMRGNHDITVLSHNNERYSLTTGQFSPTTPKGTKTISTPEGSIEEPINSLAVALVNHAGFVARGFSGDVLQLKELIIKAVNHSGYSLLEVLQPCVIWNKEKSYDYFRNRIYKLGSDYLADDRKKALDIVQNTEKLATGIIFEEHKKAYHEQVSTLSDDIPLVNKKINTINIASLLEEFV